MSDRRPALEPPARLGRRAFLGSAALGAAALAAAGFAAVDKSLAAYANPGGTFDPYTALKADDKTRMQAELASLSEKLARIPGVLGLRG